MMAMMQTWMQQTQELLAANAAAQTPARNKRAKKERVNSPLAYGSGDEDYFRDASASASIAPSGSGSAASSDSDEDDRRQVVGPRAVFAAQARALKQQDDRELSAQDEMASKKQKWKQMAVNKKKAKQKLMPESIRRGTYWGARKPKSNKIGQTRGKQANRSLSTSDLHDSKAQAKHSPTDKYGISQTLGRSRPPRHQTKARVEAMATTTLSSSAATARAAAASTKTRSKTKTGSKKSTATTSDTRKRRKREPESIRRGTFWGARKPAGGARSATGGAPKIKAKGKTNAKTSAKSKSAKGKGKGGKVTRKGKAKKNREHERERELRSVTNDDEDADSYMLQEYHVSSRAQYRDNDEYLRKLGVDPRPSTSQSGARRRAGLGHGTEGAGPGDPGLGLELGSGTERQQHETPSNHSLQWEWGRGTREAVTPARTPNMRAEELDFNALVYSSVQNTYDSDQVREKGFGQDEKDASSAAEEANEAFAAAAASTRYSDGGDGDDHIQADVLEGGISDGAVARRNAARGQREEQQGVKFALTDARSIDMEGEVDPTVLKRLGFAPGSSSGDRDRSRQLLQSRSRLQSASGGRPLSPVDERLSSPSRGVRLTSFRGDDFEHHGSTGVGGGQREGQDEARGGGRRGAQDETQVGVEEREDEIPSYLKVDHSDTARFLISAEAKARRILLQ